MWALDPVEVSQKGVSFRARLTTKGGRDAVDGWSRDASGRAHLKTRVSAASEDGKANASLVALVAKSLDVAKSTVSLTGGQTARLKCIEVSGDAAKLRAGLMAFGEVK